MNKPTSHEPIANTLESGSSLGQQLLSRLVQPAGLMDWRHLPGHRTQASAQALIQRSQLPDQIQAQYSAVGQVQPMVIPGRSRVESLALGSRDYPELAGRDVRSVIGMPTLVPETSNFRSLNSGMSSSSESSSVQLAENREAQPASMTTGPITNSMGTGIFRVSRQRHLTESNQSIEQPLVMQSSTIGSPVVETPVMQQSMNPVAPTLGSEPSAGLVLQQSPANETPVMRQIVNAVPPNLGSETATGLVLQQSPANEPESVNSNVMNAPIEASSSTIPVEIDSAIAPRVIAKFSEPTTSPDSQRSTEGDRRPLTIQSPIPGALIFRSPTIQPPLPTIPPRVSLPPPSHNTSPPINMRSGDQVALSQINHGMDNMISSSAIPRISHPLVTTTGISDGTIAPLPLNWSSSSVGNTIARMPTDASSAELFNPPIQALEKTPGNNSAPDIKRIAAQVSTILQRQLTIERERRGMKSW
jgi:hypothetical protein